MQMDERGIKRRESNLDLLAGINTKYKDQVKFRLTRAMRSTPGHSGLKTPYQCPSLSHFS